MGGEERRVELRKWGEIKCGLDLDAEGQGHVVGEDGQRRELVELVRLGHALHMEEQLGVRKKRLGVIRRRVELQRPLNEVAVVGGSSQ